MADDARRATQGCVLGFAMLALLCIGVALILLLAGDGRIIDIAQVAFLRLQLRARQAELQQPYSGDASPIRFEIAPGASAADIAEDLGEASLVRDPRLFVDYARAEGYDRRFEAGLYFLNRTQSIAQIAEILTDSSRSFIAFRSPEGARIEELAALIDDNGLFGFSGGEFLAVVGEGAALPPVFAAWAGIPEGASLEGFMFPDTYQLEPDISATGLREALLRSFRERVGDELRDEALARGWTLHKAASLAAIIEREAVWRDEHPSIAGVYHNRLAAGMPLQADPTVQYSLHGARGSWWPPITFADFQAVISPYNTFLQRGLPPGPIASPSLSAIRAAVYPAESPYFFFHAACDGSHYHVFAVSYEEHLANVCSGGSG